MDIILKSLASAGVTAIILLIAQYSGPKLAGAIGGIPIVFAISYILITMNDKTASKEFLTGGIYGAIAAIFFSIVLIWFNSKFPEHHWITFAVAYVMCFFMALGIVHFTSK
jgi:CDP-diglyceride synthetase